MKHVILLMAAVGCGGKKASPEPKEVVAPFTKEMHDWFGTPDWVK